MCVCYRRETLLPVSDAATGVRRCYRCQALLSVLHVATKGVCRAQSCNYATGVQGRALRPCDHVTARLRAHCDHATVRLRAHCHRATASTGIT